MRTLLSVFAILCFTFNGIAQKVYRIKSDTLNLTDLAITGNEDYIQTVNGSITLNMAFEQGEIKQVSLSFPTVKPFYIILPGMFLRVKLIEGTQAELIRPALYRVTPVSEGTLIFSK